MLEEIADLLTLHHGSNSAADRQQRIKLCRKHFDAVWGEMETVMPLERLRAGYDALHIELENVPSRYHQAPATAMNDELPSDLGRPKVDISERDGVPAFLGRRKAKGPADDASEATNVDLVAPR